MVPGVDLGDGRGRNGGGLQFAEVLLLAQGGNWKLDEERHSWRVAEGGLWPDTVALALAGYRHSKASAAGLALGYSRSWQGNGYQRGRVVGHLMAKLARGLPWTAEAGNCWGGFSG